MIINTKKDASVQVLLFKYLFLYPFCYLAIALISATFATFIMEWDFDGGKRYFIATGIMMWLFSYVLHFDVLKLSIREMFK